MNTGSTISITAGNSKLATQLAPKLHYGSFRLVLLVRRNAEFKEKLQNFETVSFDCRAELEEKILRVDPNVVVHTANSYATENIAWDDVIFANYEFGFIVEAVANFVAGKRNV